VRGVARDVRFRTEVSGTGGYDSSAVSSTTVLTFRIERPGHQPLPVQMRGMRIEGTLTDGDEVATGAEPRPGKVMKLKRLDNLTTGVPVVAGVPLYVKVAAVPVGAFVIGMFVFVGYQFATGTALSPW
jgi:hypothetical protein